MGYNKTKIPVLNSKDGYNHIYDIYKDYHNHLDSFDKNMFVRFLPRRLDNFCIANVGAGDGREFKLFQGKPFKKYFAIDVSEKMLKRHPGNHVEKILADAQIKIPLDDQSVDLFVSNFLFEHIEKLESLFDNVYYALKKGGTRVVSHYLPQRHFVFKKDGEEIKIEKYNYKFSDIEEIANKVGFQIYQMPVNDKTVTIGKIYCFEK